MEYSEHTLEALRGIKKGVVATLEHINDRRIKNDMTYFTSDQLDDIKDCTEILEDIHDHCARHQRHTSAPEVM